MTEREGAYNSDDVKGYLTNNYSALIHPPKKGHLLALYLKNNKNSRKVVEELQPTFDDRTLNTPAVKTKLNRLYKQFQLLKKNRAKQGPAKLVNLFEELFKIPFVDAPLKLKPECLPCIDKDITIKALESQNAKLQGSLELLQEKHKSDLSDLTVGFGRHTSKLSLDNKELSNSLRKITQQSARRKASSTKANKAKKQLKSKLKQKGAPEEIKLELKKTKISRSFAIRRADKTSEKLKDAEAVIAGLQKEISEFEASVEFYEDSIRELEIDNPRPQPVEEESVPDSHKKQFPPKIRIQTYIQLVEGVSTGSQARVANGVAKAMGKTSIDTPSKSTCARMSNELDVLNYLHAARQLLTADQATLAWDAGTQDGKHVNDVYVMLPGKVKLNLSITQLPGGTAVDYATHVDHVVTDLARVYSSYEALEYADIKKKMITRIKATMSDRAVVC